MKNSNDGEPLLVTLAAELLSDERVLAASERGLLFDLLEESRTQSTGNADLDDAVSRRLVSAVVGSVGGRIVNALADELVRQLVSHGGGRSPDTKRAPQVSPTGPGNSGAPQVSPSNPGNLTRVPPGPGDGPGRPPAPPGGNNMMPQVSPTGPGNSGAPQVSPSNPGNYLMPQVSPTGPGNSGAPQVSPSNPGNLQAPEPSTRSAGDAVPGAKSARKR